MATTEQQLTKMVSEMGVESLIGGLMNFKRHYVENLTLKMGDIMSSRIYNAIELKTISFILFKRLEEKHPGLTLEVFNKNIKNYEYELREIQAWINEADKFGGMLSELFDKNKPH